MNKRGNLILVVLIIAVFAVSSYFIVFKNLNVFSGKAVDTYGNQIDSPNPVCGDNVTNGHEECDGKDNANCADAQFCNSSCSCKYISNNSICGNSILESSEECDDGNQIDGDGCSAGCINEFCNDGKINNLNSATNVYEECEQLEVAPLPTEEIICKNDLICKETYPSGKCVKPNEKICITNPSDITLPDRKKCEEDSNCNTKEKCVQKLGICKFSIVECSFDSVLPKGLFCTNVDGRGCSADCKTEVKCGDGIVQENGIDRIPETADDEECDKPVCVNPNSEGEDCIDDIDCSISVLGVSIAGKCVKSKSVCVLHPDITCYMGLDCFDSSTPKEQWDYYKKNNLDYNDITLKDLCVPEKIGKCEYPYISCKEERDCPKSQTCKNIDNDPGKCNSECKQECDVIKLDFKLEGADEYDDINKFVGKMRETRFFDPRDIGITPFYDVETIASVTCPNNNFSRFKGDLFELGFSDINNILVFPRGAALSDTSVEKDGARIYKTLFQGWKDGWFGDSAINVMLKTKIVYTKLMSNNKMIAAQSFPVGSVIRIFGTSRNLKLSSRTIEPATQAINTFIDYDNPKLIMSFAENNLINGFFVIEPYAYFHLKDPKFIHNVYLESVRPDDDIRAGGNNLALIYSFTLRESTQNIVSKFMLKLSPEPPTVPVFKDAPELGKAIVTMHQVSHLFGLEDEYIVNVGFGPYVGGVNCFNNLPLIFLPNGKAYEGCTEENAVRTSKDSLMQGGKTNLALPLLNLWSCAHVANNILTRSDDKLLKSLELCKTLNVIKETPGTEIVKCFKDKDCKNEDSKMLGKKCNQGKYDGPFDNFCEYFRCSNDADCNHNLNFAGICDEKGTATLEDNQCRYGECFDFIHCKAKDTNIKFCDLGKKKEKVEIEDNNCHYGMCYSDDDCPNLGPREAAFRCNNGKNKGLYEIEDNFCEFGECKYTEDRICERKAPAGKRGICNQGKDDSTITDNFCEFK